MCKINLDFTVRGMRNAAAADPDSIRERLIATADRATAIAAAAEREGRTLTVDERASVDELHSEFLGLRAELDAIDRVQGMQRALAEPMPRGALPPDVVAAANAEAASGRATVSDRRRGIVLPVNCARASSILLPRSADAFGQNVEAFFQSVARGVADPRMLNLTGTESSGADGGFAVPNFWFAGILDQAMQAAEFAPRCLLFPTSTNGITIPMPDTQNRSTDIAGLSANWAGENQQQTAQRMKWRNVDVRLHKIFLLAEASGELAADGLNFAAQLETKMAEAAAFALDAAILRGTGAGQPLGILNDPSAIAVNPESGQTAGTVLYQNLINMFGRISPASQKRATWFISPSVLGQLLQMSWPGSTIPILLGNGNATNAAAGEFVGTILGRPVVTTEVCNPIGDAGDIVIADLSQFALAMRTTARIEVDRSHGFDRDAIAWRLIWRVSGCGMWNSAITPYAGGPTLGWCAYLNART